MTPTAAALRAKLLRLPGFSAHPVCGSCGKQVPVKAWGASACKACERTGAVALTRRGS